MSAVVSFRGQGYWCWLGWPRQLLVSRIQLKYSICSRS